MVLALAATAVAQQAQDEVRQLLRVEFELPGEEWTRPRIVGHVYNDSGYRVGSVRLVGPRWAKLETKFQLREGK